MLPDDAQRRACRFEARGGVEAYLETAARSLADDGRLYLVFQTIWTDRVLDSAHTHGFILTGQADFLMRTDRDQPFLSVYEFSREPSGSKPHRISMAVRCANGEISESYQQIRSELGLNAP